MVNASDISRLCDEIASTRGVQRVMLFGSYAYGSPTDDSDVDFLVVKPYRGASYRAASRIRITVRANMSTDILVRSPAEIRRRLKLNDFFIREIMEKGIVLYDSNDTRMGAEGRRRLRRRLHSAPLAKADKV
ncbi:MAG: nucleotidyltransferase domain-containing protein [Tepidisphaerales bacterium]